MPTEIIPIGSTNTNSSDVVVLSGDNLVIALKDDDGLYIRPGATVDILLKDDDGQYFRVDTLTFQKTAVVISAGGTYRFTRRNKAGVSCGVFSG